MAYPETLPTPSVDPPDEWGATLNTAVGNIDTRLDGNETAEDADLQVIRRSGSDWVWRDQVVTERPTLPAGTRVLWLTDSEAGFVTPPDLAVAYDLWKPHKDAVTSPPAAESGGITVVAAEAAYVRKDGSTMTGALVVPAPTLSTHVPRLARTPNATTGDLGLPGFAGSSTGWRNVTPDPLPSGITSMASLHIIRTGNSVTLAVNGAVSASTGLGSLYTPPVGFKKQSGPPAVGALANSASGAPIDGVLYVAAASSVVSMYRSGTLNHFGSITWATGEAWPTSLPGTEVTAPAAWA